MAWEITPLPQLGFLRGVFLANHFASTDNLSLNGHFRGGSGLLDFIGAKDDGDSGENWSYETCKAPVKWLPPTNQHPAFSRLDALPVTQPTVSEHEGNWQVLIIPSM